jgi:hypothetical protein
LVLVTTKKESGAMSRSGYEDECDYGWQTIMWRGAVASAVRGRRGQAFLKEMLAALDALPEKKLISCNLETDEGTVCAIGAVGKARGIAMWAIDPEDRENVADVFGIAEALAAEIVYENDEATAYWREETPEARFDRMRRWVVTQIKETPDAQT